MELHKPPFSVLGRARTPEGNTRERGRQIPEDFLRQHCWPSGLRGEEPGRPGMGHARPWGDSQPKGGCVAGGLGEG